MLDDDELEPAASSEECYLEVIEMLLDTLKVKRVMSDEEIADICQGVCYRLVEAGQPMSVRKLLDLEDHLLNRG